MLKGRLSNFMHILSAKRAEPIITPKQVGASEVGWSENSIFAGNLPKYNPDELIGRKGHEIYRKMMMDEQVKAVIRFKRDAITARDFQLMIPNAETNGLSEKETTRRVEIYEAMVRETYGSFVDGLNYVLMAMYQGFSMTEKIIDTFEFQGRPFLGLKEMVPKPFQTFEFHTDDFGSIREIKQVLNSGREQTIDLNRFVYYVQNPEFDQHYGQSDLREAYRSWYSKDVIIRLYNRFLERFAGGFAVGVAKQGMVLTPGSPDYAAMQAVMNGIQGSTSVVLPHGVSLEIENPSSTDQFERAIGLYDLGIAKSLLVPNLLGITPQASSGGGFAQANTQLEAFLWTLDADATRLQEAINEQVFVPLNKVNFPDGIGPLLRWKAVSDTKKMELIKTWKELVTAGAAEASETDEHHLRELLDFPHKGEPLELESNVGLPTEVPPQSRKRGPVKEPNQQRKDNTRGDAAFARAVKRVMFTVIERQSMTLEQQGTEAIESSLGDMLAELTTRVREEKLGTNAAGFDAIKALDFNKRLKTKARKQAERMLQDAWALGLKHSKSELAAAREESFSLNFGRIDDDAAEFLRLNGFRMLGNLTDDMRAVVLNTLVNGIKFSWTIDELVNKIYDNLTSAGFIALATNAEATARVAAEISEALDGAVTLGRLRTAVRTNVFEAINEARYSTFTDPALGGFVEAIEYSAILDNRTTQICRHLDDRVYETNDDVWNKYRPPNHFNCRSLLVPVTIIDTDVEGKDSPANSRFSRPPTIEPQKGFG